jgi:hypothetical protein
MRRSKKEQMKPEDDTEEQKKIIRKFRHDAWTIATQRMREIGYEQIDRGLIPEGNIFFMGALIFQGMNEEFIKSALGQMACDHKECEENRTQEKEKLVLNRGLH